MTEFVLEPLSDTSDRALLRELRRVARLVPAHPPTRAGAPTRTGAHMRAGARAKPIPLTRKLFDAHARVSAETVAGRFGGWQAALEAAGLGHRWSGAVITEKRRAKRSRFMTDEELLAELRGLAQRLGKPALTRREFDNHAAIGSYVYFTRFGAWGEALRRAGLAQTRGTRRFGDTDLADNLRTVWTRLGRQPAAADMSRAPSRISARTYQTRFGSWRRALTAFVAFAAGKRKRYVPRAASLEITPPHRTRSYARRRKTQVAGAPGAHGGAVGWQGRLPPERRGRAVPLGLRFEIIERDHFRCVACGRGPATHRGLMLHVDHIVPWSKGGMTVAENLRALCVECNLGRGDGGKPGEG